MDFRNDRSVFYANRAASKQKLVSGTVSTSIFSIIFVLFYQCIKTLQTRKESAIQDCTKAVELNSSYVKAYLRRAVLYEESDKLDEALEDYKKVLEFDPRNQEAMSASMVGVPNIRLTSKRCQNYNLFFPLCRDCPNR